MRARAVFLAVVPLVLAAASAAAQSYAGDCLVRPNSRGGTSISCSRRNDYARESRQIAAEARRNALAISRDIRAQTRASASAARAEARAFERRWNSNTSAMRIRERMESLRLRRPALRYQRW
jgi:hypothetical protein